MHSLQELDVSSCRNVCEARDHTDRCSCFLQGFDEYMNLVLDEAEEVHIKNKTKKTLGERSGVCA